MQCKLFINTTIVIPKNIIINWKNWNEVFEKTNTTIWSEQNESFLYTSKLVLPGVWLNRKIGRYSKWIEKKASLFIKQVFKWKFLIKILLYEKLNWQHCSFSLFFVQIFYVEFWWHFLNSNYWIFHFTMFFSCGCVFFRTHFSFEFILFSYKHVWFLIAFYLLKFISFLTFVPEFLSFTFLSSVINQFKLFVYS